MRHFLLSLLVAVFFAATLSQANAQVPRMFSYQGVVLNPTTGNFISDGPHNIMIKLYDAFSASTPIYTENQMGVVFVKGIFNVMIGSVTSIPNTVAFDKGYFLGVSIDGGAEMSPRTAISPAPYTMFSALSGGLVAGATGAVTAINGQSGAINLVQGAGTVITNNGSTFTISSTGVGGTGIQGVQNSDPSITVANPTGPTASVSVATGGITTTKLANGAVTAAKIDASGITSGFVLTANGIGGSSWLAPVVGGGGLGLPYSGTVVAGGAAFAVTNTGLGGAGSFTSTNAASTAFVLEANSNGAVSSIGIYGSNTGSGRAGFIEILNATNTSAALTGKTQGLGDAVDVTISNSSNSSDALHTTTDGTGRAGYFQTTNAANTSNALSSITNGTGGAGYFEVTSSSPTVPALKVKTASTDPLTLGIYSVISNSTSGVSNVATAVKAEHAGTNSIGIGLWGLHHGTGTGIFGQVLGDGGYGIYAQGLGNNSIPLLADYQGSLTTGNAVEIRNGFIKVSGASKTAFVITTTAANTNGNSVSLSYPGMSPTDMVFVTHNWVAARFNNGYGVWWNALANDWEIFLENNPPGVMPLGEKFNVLVIRQ